MIWARRVLVLVTCGYLLITLMFAALQRSLIYPASKSSSLPVAQFLIGDGNAADVQTVTSDGLTLHGWHFKSASGEQQDAEVPLVIFLHGNGGNRIHRLDDVELLTSLGVEVLLFDYRGYGENAGSPSESGLRIDARSIWDFAITDLGVNPRRVILFGESLGGAVAVRLAAETSAQGTPPGGMILRSTFSSMTEAAAYHYPWLPIRIALLDRYNARSQIGSATCPILCLHGDDDDIVPLELGKRLFDAAPQKSVNGVAKRFARLPGAGHNDVLQTARQELKTALARFLSTIPRSP